MDTLGSIPEGLTDKQREHFYFEWCLQEDHILYYEYLNTLKEWSTS